MFIIAKCNNRQYGTVILLAETTLHRYCKLQTYFRNLQYHDRLLRCKPILRSLFGQIFGNDLKFLHGRHDIGVNRKTERRSTMAYVIATRQEEQERLDNTNWPQRLGIAVFLLEEYTVNKLSRISRLFRTTKRRGNSEQKKLSVQLPETRQTTYLRKCHSINLSMNNGGGTRTFTLFTKTRLP